MLVRHIVTMACVDGNDFGELLSPEELSAIASTNGMTPDEMATFLYGVVGETRVPEPEYDETQDEAKRIARENNISVEQATEFLRSTVDTGSVGDGNIHGFAIPGRYACLLYAIEGLLRGVANRIPSRHRGNFLRNCIPAERWGEMLDFVSNGGDILEALARYRIGAGLVLLKTIIGGRSVDSVQPLLIKNDLFNPHDANNNHLAVVMYTASGFDSGDGHYIGVSEETLIREHGYGIDVLRIGLSEVE